MTTAVLIPLAWLIVGLLVVAILLLVALLHRTPRDRGHRPTHQPRPSGARRDRPAPAHPDAPTSVDLRPHIPAQRQPGQSPTLFTPGRWTP